jgi:hypothetical protein
VVSELSRERQWRRILQRETRGGVGSELDKGSERGEYVAPCQLQGAILSASSSSSRTVGALARVRLAGRRLRFGC